MSEFDDRTPRARRRGEGPSRRAFLGLGIGTLAAAGSGSLAHATWRPPARTTGEVIEFEGSGGGANDSPRLAEAVDRFQRAGDGATLMIRNTVRCATRGGMKLPGTDAAAILVRGGNRKTIVFSDGAELVLDNLDPAGNGTSHGIVWLGAGASNSLINPRVRWARPPSARSYGDGIRIVGYPSLAAPGAGWRYTTGTMRDFVLRGWSVTNAPQSGAILMGCWRPTVTAGEARATRADGLHFNACHAPVVERHTSLDTGDDGLAFVTYFDRDAVAQGPFGPFNRPALDTWSNQDAAARDIVVDGGRADGLRVSGAMDVAVTNLRVVDKDKCGVIVDSAIADDQYRWSYLASRNIRIESANIAGCTNGVMVAAQNVGPSDPAAFRQFDVRFADIAVNSSRAAPYVLASRPDLAGKLSGVSFPVGVPVRSKPIS